MKTMNVQYLIVALWGCLGSGVNKAIDKWDNVSTGKQVLMVLLILLIVGVSLDLVVRYKPTPVLNPYLAGPKTKALFNRKPLLAGFITMTFFVAVMVGIMQVLN